MSDNQEIARLEAEVARLTRDRDELVGTVRNVWTILDQKWGEDRSAAERAVLSMLFMRLPENKALAPEAPHA